LSDRDKEFCQSIDPSNIFEAFRLAVTKATDAFAIHEDSKNDHTHPCLMPVYGYSKLVLYGNEWYHVALIGYSRSSITRCILRRQKYSPYVEALKRFYNSQPDERRVVCPHLLLDPDGNTEVIRLDPNMNKCVFYSPFVSVLWNYSPSAGEMKLALLYCSVFSNTPDPFWYFYTDVDLDEFDCPVRMVQRYIAFVNAFEKGNKNMGGLRHQPHYGTRSVTDEQIKYSLSVLSRLVDAMWDLEAKGELQLYYYSLSVRILSKQVNYCGSLTSQHLLAIAALSGIVPTRLLNYGELSGETTEAARLCQQYDWPPESWDDHSEQIVRAFSVECGVPGLVPENVSCEFGRSECQTVGRYHDSLYCGQPLWDYDTKGNAIIRYDYGEPPRRVAVKAPKHGYSAHTNPLTFWLLRPKNCRLPKKRPRGRDVSSVMSRQQKCVRKSYQLADVMRVIDITPVRVPLCYRRSCAYLLFGRLHRVSFKDKSETSMLYCYFLALPGGEEYTPPPRSFVLDMMGNPASTFVRVDKEGRELQHFGNKKDSQAYCLWCFFYDFTPKQDIVSTIIPHLLEKAKSLCPLRRSERIAWNAHNDRDRKRRLITSHNGFGNKRPKTPKIKPQIEPLSTVALYDPLSGEEKKIVCVLYEWDDEFSMHHILEKVDVESGNIVRTYVGEPVYFPK
jgi:hypothetical protein